MASIITEDDKRKSALETLRDEPPLVLLCFNEAAKGRKGKDQIGVLAISCIKSNTRRWFTMVTPTTPEDDINGKDAEGVGCIFAGIGHYGDFKRLFEIYKEIVQEDARPTGIYGNFTESTVGRLSEFIRDKFSSADEINAYAVEIAVATLWRGEIEIFRVKFDGNLEKNIPYCIIGGSQAVGRSSKSATESAEQICRKLYAKWERTGQLPDIGIVKKAAGRIVSLYKPAGKIVAVSAAIPY